MNIAFIRDLQDGQKFEKFLLPSIQKKHSSAVLAPDGCKEYDIKTDKKTYECKMDFESANTKNIAIEIYRERFKEKGVYDDTGLRITTADYWLQGFRDSDGIWKVACFPINILHEICIDKPIAPMGDGKRTFGYLIPKGLLQLYPEAKLIPMNKLA